MAKVNRANNVTRVSCSNDVVDVVRATTQSKDNIGFTLVELLVVIAIIALLASIVVPALSSAKQAAMSAVCGGNLRQLGMAAMMYEEDSNGYLPRPFGRWGADPYEVWFEGLAGYSGVPPLSEAAPPVKSIWTCPVQYSMYPDRTTYSMNHQLQGHILTGSYDDQYLPVNRSDVSGPGKVQTDRWPCTAATIPYFLDGCVFGNISAGYLTWRRLIHDSIFAASEIALTRSYPHSLGCNIVFLDGHVEKMIRHKTGVFERPTEWSFIPQWANGVNAF